MKRLIVMGLCLMAAVSSYAQTGNYDWNSFSGNPSSSTGVVRDASNNPLNGATFFAQVWGGTVNNPATFTSQSEIYSFSINTAAGASSYGQILSGQEVSQNMNQGDTMFFVINAWNATAGSSWQQALASTTAGAQRGSSTVSSLVLASSIAIPQPEAGNFASFSMTAVAVPEPSTIVLGALGLVGLFLRRRT